MTNVLLVGKGPPERGGIPTFLTQMEHADWADQTVRLLNLAHEAEQQGGQFTAGNIGRTVTDARRLARVATDGAIDIVHIHTALAPLSTMIRAFALATGGGLRGRRVIVHAHGGRLVGWADSGWKRRLLAWCLRPADAVIVVSDGLRKTMVAAGVGAKTEFIGNGVDVERFQPSVNNSFAGDSPPVILYVGHLSQRKGVVDLLSASAMLEERGVQHRLQLVGGVPDEGDADREPVEQALTASTQRLGPVDPAEMPELYRQADVFCLPSWWEATPLSVLEAMASGLAVVGSDVGDIAAMVGTAGWIVPPQRPSQLADVLQEVLRDETERKRRGREARVAAENGHNLRRTLARIAEVYARLSPAGGRDQEN